MTSLSRRVYCWVASILDCPSVNPFGLSSMGILSGYERCPDFSIVELLLERLGNDTIMNNIEILVEDTLLMITMDLRR